MSVELVGPSGRERAKNSRRERIIAATCALMREKGAEGLSIKSISDRAQVSVATVYNLIGPKQAVLEEVFKFEFELTQTLVRSVEISDPIDRIFQILLVLVENYKSDQAFYKTLYSLMGVGDKKHSEDIPPIGRYEFWGDLIFSMSSDDVLIKGADPHTVGKLMNWVYGAVFVEVLLDRADVSEFMSNATFGLSVALLPFVRDDIKPRIQAKIDSYIFNKDRPVGKAD